MVETMELEMVLVQQASGDTEDPQYFPHPLSLILRTPADGLQIVGIIWMSGLIHRWGQIGTSKDVFY